MKIRRLISITAMALFAAPAGPFLTQLPTLGGDNEHADHVNNRGEVAGWLKNTTPDPTCILVSVR